MQWMTAAGTRATASGWELRAVPLGETTADASGVSCDQCHKMTDPDRSENLGVQIAPYEAHDGGTPPTGYYGGAMAVMWPGTEKLGPLANAAAPHQFRLSSRNPGQHAVEATQGNRPHAEGSPRLRSGAP